MALLELARENHARLLLLSSGAVYGQSSGKEEIEIKAGRVDGEQRTGHGHAG